MKLKPNDICPIHRSRFCCGRDFKKIQKRGKWIVIGPGVRKHIETGLIRRSPSAMRQLLAKKVKEQWGQCAICEKEFKDAREISPDHINPRGMGGARRDDSEENIQAVHNLCNLEKGSKRIA